VTDHAKKIVETILRRPDLQAVLRRDTDSLARAIGMRERLREAPSSPEGNAVALATVLSTAAVAGAVAVCGLVSTLAISARSNAKRG